MNSLLFSLWGLASLASAAPQHGYYLPVVTVTVTERCNTTASSTTTAFIPHTTHASSANSSTANRTSSWIVPYIPPSSLAPSPSPSDDCSSPTVLIWYGPTPSSSAASTSSSDPLGGDDPLPSASATSTSSSDPSLSPYLPYEPLSSTTTPTPSPYPDAATTSLIDAASSTDSALPPYLNEPSSIIAYIPSSPSATQSISIVDSADPTYAASTTAPIYLLPLPSSTSTAAPLESLSSAVTASAGGYYNYNPRGYREPRTLVTRATAAAEAGIVG